MPALSNNKTYTLYMVRVMNNVPVWMYVSNVMAHSIIEAEYLLEKDMQTSQEYQITCTKTSG
jgi:hypothetical protein